MRFRKTFSLILGIITAAGLSVSAVGSAAAEPAVVTESVTQRALSTSSPGDTYTKGGLLYTELDDGTYEVGYNYNGSKPGKSVTIPQTVNGKTVTRIAESGFYRCYDLESISLPKTVVSAGENAFTGTKLVSNQSGNTIRYAGHLAVECSTSATTATIKDGTLGLSDKLFALSPNIQKVTLPDSLVNLGSNTFAGCSKLYSLKIPSGITEIKDGVFYGCAKLDPVFPKNLKSIGAYAFANSGLSDANMPNVTKIGKGAFENSEIEDDVTVGDGFIEIGARAFVGTPYYDSLGKVKYIGNICIGAASTVTSVTLDEGTLGIADMAFSGCGKLNSVTIPESVTKIGSDAFFNCANLTTVNILGEGLESIGEDAFRLCSRLSNISIPTSLEAVYEGAFYGCNKLTAVSYNGSILDWAEIAFGDDNEALFNAPIVFANDPKALDPVGELTVTKTTYDRVSFSWEQSEGARVYEIYQKNGSSWKKIDELAGDSTFYTVDNLSQNTDYTFRVTAKTGCFGTSAEITAHTLFQPMYNLKATAGEDSVSLSWDKNAGAAYYRVDMLSDGEWREVFRTTKNTVLTCTINELQPLTEYSFRVVGVSGELTSEASEATATTTASTKPAEVTGVSGTATETAVKVTWEKHPNADRYQVDIYKAGALFKSVKTTALYYNFTGLTHETEYEIRVYAIKGAKTSLPAKTYFTTLSLRPAKPENLTAAESMYSVKLTWDKAVKANKYRIDVYKNDKWVTVNSGTTALSYNVSGLSANTEYDFRVYALNGTIPSAEPAEITKTTLSDIPDTVDNLTAEPSVYSVKLSWDKSAIANKYRIDVLKNDKWITVNAKCTALTYNVTGLAANTEYKFRVYSYYGNIMNPEPAELVKTTCSDIPEPVADLSAEPGPYNMRLSWSKSPIADKYRIDVLKNDKWVTANARFTGTTFTVTGLSAQTEYKFRVYALFGSKMSEVTEIAETTLTDIPDAVENLEAVPDVFSVKLTWDKSSIADKYRIDVFKNGRWTTVNARCTALTYNVTGLAANTTYAFRVYALFGSKTSEMTEIAATTLIPEAVENLTAVPDMYSVKLTWDKSAMANKYRIDVLKNGKWVTVNAKCTALTYNVTGLTALTEYKFRVYALNNNVSSEATEIAATTLTDIPDAVKNLTAVPDMYSVKLSWDKSPKANKYRIDVLKNGKWVTVNAKCTALTYNVTGLTALTDYQFRVYALNNTKLSEVTEIPATTLTDIPDAVENLTAVPDMYSVKLSWDKSPKANKYRIDVLKNGKWVTVNAKCTALTYNVTGLTALTEYQFRVYALNNTKLSEVKEIAATTLTDIPEAVENLTAVPDMYSVKLSWDKSPKANKYRIDVFKNGSWVTVNAKCTALTYTVTGLTALTDYQFRVYALNNTKLSEVTEIAATTLTDIPDAVKNLTAVPDMYSVKLSWDKSPKANKYRIDIFKNGSWVTVNAKCTALTYNVTGLTANTSYEFRVYALNGNKTSEEPSEIITAVTLTDIPEAVTGLTAERSMYSIKLSWDKNKIADKYRIDIYKNGKWTTLNAKCTALYYNVTGLSALTEYDFRVYAIYRSNISPEAELTATTLTDIPEAVTNIAANNLDTTKFTLTWDKSEIADKYHVEMQVGETWKSLIKTTALSYNVTGLMPNTEYKFRVTPIRGTKSGGAEEFVMKTASKQPSPVQNLEAIAKPNSVKLLWDKSLLADSYQIEMLKNDVWVSVAKTTATSYNVTGLSESTAYEFRIRAVNYVELSDSVRIGVITKKSLAPILDLSLQFGDSRMMMKGIDVSGWNGDIDFNAVKKSGVDFVIIKAGYSTSTVDTWETNYKNAKKAGLKVGAYWYSYATTLSQGRSEAKAFIKAMNGKKLDFPVYFDLEESSQFNKGMTFCTNLVDTFCEEVEDAGYLAGVYCSRYWYTNFVSEDVRLSRPTWIADYSRACDYGGSYGIWQYTGEGRVAGIDGYCDLNWAYTDYSSFIKRNGLNGY